MKRVGLHLLFWSAILFWKSNADCCCGESLMFFVTNNLIRLPFVITATYLVLYHLLPKYIFRQKKYKKFAFLFLLNFIIAITIDQKLIESDLIHQIGASIGYQYKLHLYWHPYRSSFICLFLF